MKNKWLKISAFILALALVITTFSILVREPIFLDSQQVRYPSVFISDYGSYEAYKFNPETILESLNKGNTNVFTSVTSMSGEHVSSTLFPLKQSDYLTIANAMQQFASRGAVENWSLHDIFLDGDCQYNPLGFDIVRLSYYKPTGLQEYSARMIAIYPLSGEGEMGVSGYFPRSLFSSWDYIDLEKLKVTAEDAIQLAEDNGGKQFRLALNNMCRIHLGLSSYSRPSWDVSYSNEQAPMKRFEIKIEAYTGEYKVTQLK